MAGRGEESNLTPSASASIRAPAHEIAILPFIREYGEAAERIADMNRAVAVFRAGA